ncbi:hypothetical protein CW313_06910 [Acinetobacter radioresistens]|nr:hypothetical protein CW313_06910 [Acinetobacter radioresistens]
MRLYLSFLLLGLSYLSPNSSLLWPNSLQDFFAILSLILLLLTFNLNNFLINKYLFLVFLLLISIPVIQYNLKIIYFKQELFLSCLYITIFFSSIFLGSSIHNSQKVFIKFSIFFLVIGVLCVLIQIFQWIAVYSSIFINDLNSSRLSANIGQPNQLASLLSISLISCLILYKNKKIKVLIFSTCSVLIIFGIVLTQSRTSWLIFILIILFSYFKKNLKLTKYVTIFSTIFYGLLITYPFFYNSIHKKDISIIQRLNSDYSRLDIWQQMLFAIIERPWFGYGWNQTSVAQTEISLYHTTSIWIEYSHNLFLDFLIWNGIPLGIILITIIIFWFIYMYVNIKDLNSFMILIIISSFFIHCLLEFPFAYAYFIFPIGLYIGIINKRYLKYNYFNFNNWNYIFGLIIIFLLFFIVKDYIKITEKHKEYSLKYFSDNSILPNKLDIYLLDSLNVKEDIQYLDICYLIKIYNSEEIRNNFLRYPTNKSAVSLYYISLYNKNVSLETISFMKWKFQNLDLNTLKINKRCNTL